MGKSNFLEQKMTEIANLKVELGMQGGPNNNCDLFEKTIRLEDLILKKFGLPNNPKYNKVLSFIEIPSEIDVKKRIEILRLEAEKYLSLNTKSDIGILSDAQKFKENWSYVLPEIKVITHGYTIFVFDKILLEQKDNIENILNDLRFVNNHFDILNTLGKLELGQLKDVDKTIKLLKESGVRYVDEYVKEYL